jgi:nucleoside-diphosphate-sugar epimerase
MRVLITGHLGYFGCVLTRVLQRAGHEVVGLDCDLYSGCDAGAVPSVPSKSIDIRDVEASDLSSVDAVAHLAALPEDFPGSLDPELIEQVNFEGTMRLAACAKRAGVSRYLFASSCAVYGRSGDVLCEGSAVEPLTAYATAKLRCERELARLADGGFAPVMLRNATLCGMSPRLRLDTVVNDFVASAVTSGRIQMKTAGRAWRPLLHVQDAAHAYAAVLAASAERVHNQVINIVDGRSNHRIIDLADLVCESIPPCTRTPCRNQFDPRSYRVESTKLQRLCPDLQFRWPLQRTIAELASALPAMGLTAGDWRADRFRRVLHLAALVESGRLDDDLRRATNVTTRYQRTRRAEVRALALSLH